MKTFLVSTKSTVEKPIKATMMILDSKTKTLRLMVGKSLVAVFPLSCLESAIEQESLVGRTESPARLEDLAAYLEAQGIHAPALDVGRKNTN